MQISEVLSSAGNKYVSVAYKLQAVTQVVLHVSLFYASSSFCIGVTQALTGESG